MTEINRGGDARSGMVLGSDTVAAVARQAEAWASVQCELLSGVEAMWVGWMQRRRDALDASTRSLTQICECRNVADIVQIQQQWLTDAVQRTASDLNAIANDTVALTSRVARHAPTGDAARQPAAPRQQRAEAEAPLHREAAE